MNPNPMFATDSLVTSPTNNVIELEKLVTNRSIFDSSVYTPLKEAVVELALRQNDTAIDAYLTQQGVDVPDMLTGKSIAVLHRQIVTPNYEVLRFVSIVDAMDMYPVFFEYESDKFVTENEWKYALAHMGFYKGVGKKGGIKVDYLNIIDFNTSNGKSLSEIKTFWGQTLVEYHHELFINRFPSLERHIYNGSDWYVRHGKVAENYYKAFLALFLKHGILFENFMLNEKEFAFTEEVFLPAFMSVWKETGKKPLVVALEPTNIEGDLFWTYYPENLKKEVEARLSKSKQ